MIDASTLKEGDTVQFVSVRERPAVWSVGVVKQATEEGNYVSVLWRKAPRVDILSRTSPLWELLEKVKT